MNGGDHIVQYGAGSVGKQQHFGSGDIVTGGKGAAGADAALTEFLRAVAAMRPHVGEKEQADLEADVRRIDADGRDLRTPLQRISGIAALAGEVGVPVIEAAKKLLSCFQG